ncbi:hypothetical protein R1flu_006560 [Riccia fluitans]|uniref:Uncharacterized protein n=1 Tax=Riccia fluitans TaxID=41844 RepID=A0ABD1YWD3_9MARC
MRGGIERGVEAMFDDDGNQAKRHCSWGLRPIESRVKDFSGAFDNLDSWVSNRKLEGFISEAWTCLVER